MVRKILETLSRERPVGTPGNDAVLAYLEEHLRNMEYDVRSLPFSCRIWERGRSVLTINGREFEVFPGTFSRGFSGTAGTAAAGTMAELETLDCRGRILLLTGELTKGPLQPKDYPFYYPEDHRRLITLLEEKAPAAIVAATGQHPLCGMDPFPLFEDGNFTIPSAYISAGILREIESDFPGGSAALTINSKTLPARSRQLVASRRVVQPRGRIVFCAHMDTAYNTPGALDNAAGTAVLLEAARGLGSGVFGVDIVPVNGEDYYGAPGMLAYLAYLEQGGGIPGGPPVLPLLVINSDSPCHRGSRTAVSFYNLDESARLLAEDIIGRRKETVTGEPWYAGDHVPFAVKGIPCLALASSDMGSGGLRDTHTPRDTLDTVDPGLVEPSAYFIADFIKEFTAAFTGS
ncbi:M28 family peptidase [Breznakiella homolactica]|uniref:M28 family peptidase n=1 Tax=Breznakiella homolactica TaxID=2798577 RepID=A0A7T7XLY3_9SPIR|nr:M28 family peptidase [Breznakiella homolactica]QQO08819.1 M28 family peptidase [Breznakiella homolactica]